jgi:hypothetical protein
LTAEFLLYNHRIYTQPVSPDIESASRKFGTLDKFIGFAFDYMKMSNTMIQLTKEQINEIADNLIFGFRCFVNIKTGEIKEMYNPDNFMVGDLEPWEEDLKDLEENWGDYLEIDGMSSDDSFKVMADFAEEVDNPFVRERLINALNRLKPFRNFKREIDDSGKYRDRWFEFKHQRYVEWVKNQIAL